MFKNQSKKMIINKACESSRGDSPAVLIPIEPIQSDHEGDRCAKTVSQVSHLNEHDKPIEAYFELHQVIGTGGFSKVRRATHKSTRSTYAIKILDKSKIETNEFPRVIIEIETMASLCHPHVCKLYSAFYTSSKIYLVMECCYTDLCEYLVKLRKPLIEVDARRIFMQLLSAVGYLHNMNIVHRDIKPENILLTRNMRIKLSDFGFASKLSRDRQLLSTFCGSLAYGAPEVILAQPYCGEKADIWSLGVNLYVLLTKRQPFFSRNLNDLRMQIISGSLPENEYISKSAWNLMKTILNLQPEKRPTIQEIWDDPWITTDRQFLLSLKRQCQCDQVQAVNPKNYNLSTSLFSSSSIELHPQETDATPIQEQAPIKRKRIRAFLLLARNKFSKLRNFLRKT